MPAGFLRFLLTFAPNMHLKKSITLKRMEKRIDKSVIGRWATQMRI